MKMIENIEDGWSSSTIPSRIYRAILIITDGLVYNVNSNPGKSLINIVSSVRYRCTPILTLVPYRFTDGKKVQQDLSLKILTGNKLEISSFETAKLYGPSHVIPKIGNAITSLLLSDIVDNPQCSDPTSFSTSSSYWCGHYRANYCEARTSCYFVYGSKACRKIDSMSGCNVGDQITCESTTGCRWTGSKCSRIPEEIDCNGLVIQQSCNSKSLYCMWDSTTQLCVNKSG